MRGERPDAAGTGTTSAGTGGSADESRATGSGRDRMAEEFRLLLDAAAGRAEEYLRGLGGAEHAAHAGTGDLGTGDGPTPNGPPPDGPAPGARDGAREDRGGPSCGWCPVCAIASLLRGERPELTSRLADQLAGLLDLLRESAEPRPAGAAAPPPEPAEPAPSKVQRIDVRRVRGRTAAQAASGGAEC